VHTAEKWNGSRSHKQVDVFFSLQTLENFFNGRQRGTGESDENQTASETTKRASLGPRTRSMMESRISFFF
jgi:hypothetical protein